MLDAYRDLIDELLGTPAEIREAMGDDAPPAAREIVAALRDRDRAVLERVQTITRQQSPYLKALALPAAPAAADLPTLLDEMDVARGDLVSLLMNLTLKDWEREAIHETEGQITLADEVEQHVEFDEAQRERLRALRPSP
jgi:hypothetical protein